LKVCGMSRRLEKGISISDGRFNVSGAAVVAMTEHSAAGGYGLRFGQHAHIGAPPVASGAGLLRGRPTCVRLARRFLGARFV